MKKLNLKKGFTLIELLVVVAIIGILATIVTGFLGNSKAKGTDSKVRNQLSQMNSQAFLFSGTLGTAYTVATPYLVSAGITGAASGGTAASGTLFNDTSLTSNSLYTLASKLPSSSYIYYGWNGLSNTNTGRWFFAATTSTGAFCVDWSNGKKEYTGAAISAGPTVLANWTGAGVFPNATAANGYLCN